MKVTALMSWYDEPDDLLFDSVMGLRGFADELVALDGAYALFQDADQHPFSPPSNYETIAQAARDAGIAVQIHCPAGPWEGNEVEKRDTLFRLGDETKADWFYLIDGDFVTISVDPSTKAVLSRLVEHVGQVELLERLGKKDRWMAQLHPTLFRARRGMRVGPTHYHYKVEEDEWWSWSTGGEKHWPQASLGDLIKVRHEHFRRDDYRRSRQWMYYMTRNNYNIEPTPPGLPQQSDADRALELELMEKNGRILGLIPEDA